MTKGKKVKAIDAPSFLEPVSLENIGKFIKARRTQQKLSTQDTALLCNISSHTLNKIENGFEGVKFSTLLSVMNALGITLHVAPWEA
jgi:transcriptional regulator with XRE-family HTH domain